MRTFGEAYPDTPENLQDRIMHAHLENDFLCMMACDTHPVHSPPYEVGNNVHLSLVGSNSAMLSEYFEKLSVGGQISMPLEKQFLGDTYGSLTDIFGVHWMVNISSSDPKSGFLSKLSSPARNALIHEGIDTLEELSKFTEKEILKIHGMLTSNSIFESRNIKKGGDDEYICIDST